MEDWTDVMVPQITKAIARPGVQVLVAYDPDATDQLADLAGFIAFDATTAPVYVYYVYVKQAYRCGRGRIGAEGIGRGLFRAAGIDPSLPFGYACRTPIVAKISRKIPMARWDPLVARFPKADNGQRTSTTRSTTESSIGIAARSSADAPRSGNGR